MQTLTADQVTLLGSPALTVSAGCDLLNADLTFREDISGDLQGGNVSRSLYATVHGTCTLEIARELSWGTDLVRPYMTLSNGSLTSRFNLGVFSLTTPQHRPGTAPTVYDVTGYDRLYLLNRPVGDTYSVAAGTGYLAAVRTAITAAGLSGVNLDGTSEAATLPTAAVWPLIGESTATTWLRIVNDLLAAINYRGLWADENGLFRSEPYVNPSARAVEFTFAAQGPTSAVGEERTVTADLWAVPNRWVFVQQNATSAPVDGAGVYRVQNDSDGPTSIAARGLTWTRVETLDVADHAALVRRGDAMVAADKRTARLFDVETLPFPPAGHGDVFTYDDTDAGGTVKVQARQWKHSLTGANTSWLWEAVA